MSQGCVSFFNLSPSQFHLSNFLQSSSGVSCDADVTLESKLTQVSWRRMTTTWHQQHHATRPTKAAQSLRGQTVEQRLLSSDIREENRRQTSFRGVRFISGGGGQTTLACTEVLTSVHSNGREHTDAHWNASKHVLVVFKERQNVIVGLSKKRTAE